MSSNLVSPFAFLRKKFSDISGLLHSLQPSYISKLSGESGQKIIFVCLLDKNRIKSTSSESSYDSPARNSINLNLTGSPLKDECIIPMLEMSEELKIASIQPWTESEESYCPLKVSDARNMIQILVNETFDNSSGSIWMLSDCDDYQKTLLLQYVIEKGWTTRGTVHLLGQKPLTAFTMPTMLRHHCALIKNDINSLETQIEHVFNVKSNLSIITNSNDSSNNPSLVVRNKSTETTILQSINIAGITNSEAKEFWHELLLLNTLKEDIANYKTNNDPANTEPNYRIGGSDVEIEILMDKITKILSDVEIITQGSADAESLNSKLELAIMSAKYRVLMDLTDRLWEILKFCSTYRDLKHAMTFIFQKAAKCNVVNLPTNTNRLAEIVREVGQNRLAIPCLSGSEPMELLLEIGLEKVTKDYQYIFTESKIYNLNDLKISESKANSSEPALQVRKSLYKSSTTSNSTTDGDKQRKTLLHTDNRGSNSVDKSFVGFQNSKFQLQEVEATLSRLAQIHLILEHLLLIQVNLNLEGVYTSVTEHLLQRPTINFDKLMALIFDKAEIPIVNDHIFDIIEHMQPHARKVVMKSENKFKRIQNTFYQSVTPIFPPCVLPKAGVDDRDASHDVWCLHYLRISTKKQ